MTVFDMVAVIAVVGIVGSVVGEWLKRNKTPPVDLSDIENRLAKLDALKERVVILEAIVTDKGYDLKRKINDL